jgi:hypothetical protein
MIFLRKAPSPAGGSFTHAAAEIALMLISEDIFRAFLRCETKSYLNFLGSTGDQRAFTDWERNLVEDYKQKCCIGSSALDRRAGRALL